MHTWREFSAIRPELADAGRQLLYQFGVGLAFLGTVRRDGGPRMHPMCPVLTEDALYGFIEPGPKRQDLLRDGRYALHCFPPANNEDAFYVTGTVRLCDDRSLHEHVQSRFWKERGRDDVPSQAGGMMLFEFLIDSCLLTRTTGHADWHPQHTVWRARRHGSEDRTP